MGGPQPPSSCRGAYLSGAVGTRQGVFWGPLRPPLQLFLVLSWYWVQGLGRVCVHAHTAERHCRPPSPWPCTQPGDFRHHGTLNFLSRYRLKRAWGQRFQDQPGAAQMRGRGQARGSSVQCAGASPRVPCAAFPGAGQWAGSRPWSGLAGWEVEGRARAPV